MRKKKYARNYVRLIKESYALYPTDSDFHKSCRKWYLEGEMWLIEKKIEDRNKFIFSLAQLIIIILLVLAIVLL